MREDLDRVPWKLLRHNYGRATDVPALLRRCGDRDVSAAGDALDDLTNLLYHQGGWVCSAASAALPFLLDLAEDVTVHHRPETVALVARLVDEASIVEARFVDQDWPGAVEPAVPRMLALLDDPDPQVRREATYLVSRPGLPAGTAVAALTQRWRTETDRITRRDLALALGALLARDPSEDSLRSELYAALDSSDSQLGLAALHALAPTLPDLPVRRLAEAVAAVRHDDAADWQESAWLGGGSRQVIVNQTARLLRHDPASATTFTLAVGRAADRDERIAGMQQAATLLAEWRAVAPGLADFLAERLADDDPEVRFRAAYLMGCVPATASGDVLAGLAADAAPRDTRQSTTVGDAAAWALARLNDPRCLPALVERLTGPRARGRTGG
ncbi:hypothetical protein AB0F81_09440 [Actinoplanes sp. NPDC024001]|uniref:hypothetical protein n=1 Tax=Actinoplanes sp. NPDC024001 TaxID=3154598 RepID=UPI0033C76A87